MTLAYREMQHADFAGFFRLEFALQYHTHRTSDER